MTGDASDKDVQDSDRPSNGVPNTSSCASCASLSRASPDASLDTEGVVFDVDTFAVHDGPGVRMAVYFKGCPLRCGWCHSPESQSARPEIIFMRDRCTLCGACARVCPEGVHTVDACGHDLDRRGCRVCARCVDECPGGALAVAGRTVRAGDIVAKAARMRTFFDHSGGGVTLTGGEVTSQPDFAAALLEGLKAEGIHTAIETCGACDWPRLERLVTLSDLVMYDLKLIDDEAHCRWTGASNRPALDNARCLGECNDVGSVDIRFALIPGITDTDETVRAVFEFMRDASLDRVVLLPYNASAPAKYEWLGRPFEVAGEPQSQERLEEIAAMAREARLRPAAG